MGRWLNGAQKVRAAMDTAGAALDDAAASRAVPLYPTLQGDGALIMAGTRINWNGTLKRAAVDLWDVPKNAPDNAPALWEEISYREGYRIIPETFAPGLGFAKGECGWWKGALYKSVFEGVNVWTPEQTPSGWERQ